MQGAGAAEEAVAAVKASLVDAGPGDDALDCGRAQSQALYPRVQALYHYRYAPGDGL